jgi:hypothetical protein
MVAQGFRPPAIARRLSLTHSYIAKLHRITRDTPPEILRDWRTARRPLSVNAMLNVAANADPGGCYLELQASFLDRRGARAMIVRAREHGRMFARLDAHGLRAPMPPYDECIAHMFPRLGPKYWAETAAEVERGWDEELVSCDDEQDDTDTG